MKFYGTMQCPFCKYADKTLRKNGVDVDYLDISVLKNLKEFMALRESREEFDDAKENGKAGIPVFLLDDGTIEFNVCNLEGVEDCSIYEEFRDSLRK